MGHRGFGESDVAGVTAFGTDAGRDFRVRRRWRQEITPTGGGRGEPGKVRRGAADFSPALSGALPRPHAVLSRDRDSVETLRAEAKGRGDQQVDRVHPCYFEWPGSAALQLCHRRRQRVRVEARAWDVA